ncbi:MAG: hypothetical protein KAR32_11335, partial [Candidatus Omnitrophica bacterium]|nr:hypothetical protein [Candidatus Omnitrophota bacterium]
VSNRVRTLSVVVIAAIFVFIDKKIGVESNFLLYKISLISYLLSLCFDFFNLTFKSAHIEKFIDGKIKTIDFRESSEGRVSERLFWAMLFLFIIGSSFFLVSLFLLNYS